MEATKKFAEALEQGYVVVRGKTNASVRLSGEYYRWCMDNKRPYIAIRLNIRYARMTIDLDGIRGSINEAGYQAAKAEILKLGRCEGVRWLGQTIISMDRIPIELTSSIVAIMTKVLSDPAYVDKRVQ
jgi:hypothetical protein